MTKVKILRNSIILNSNCGQWSQKVPIGISATFEIHGEIPESIFNDENFIITEQNYDESGTHTKGVIKIPQKLCDNYSHNVSISIHTDYTTIHQIQPIEKYLYKYDWNNYKQTCNICDKSFYIETIETYSENVNHDREPTYCPNCDSIDSFDEVIYENIDDVVKELGLE